MLHLENQLSLTFKQFSEANRKRCDESFLPVDEFSPDELGNALAGECGEVCNVIKKIGRLTRGLPIPSKDKGKTHSCFVSELSGEIADVLTYLDLLAQGFDIDLEEALRDKFNAVSLEANSPVRL